MDRSFIHITRWGGAGPPVVMVHGGVQGSAAGGARAFANQACLAADGWQLIVPDRPGHGQSPDPGRPDDAEADGAWTADLLGGGAHLVGHSFGGCVALAAAARRPGAVRSLTLIEPAMHKIAIDDPRVRRFVFRLVAASLVSISPVTKARRVMRILGIPPELRERSDPQELRRMGKALGRAALPAKAVLARQLHAVMQAGVPLLVVTGGWSEGFDATADRVAAAGGGRHVVVPTPHHFPQFEPDRFNTLLTGFLRASDAARAAPGWNDPVAGKP